ncbi:hypothetical protein L3073_17570 [Ancylomarina sp. DW003]|nr:hypothetical protein [Ancylomarina sp. DW003]MDE5424028.1 hypothetical protein [Ancylomarina sp. DW003]
MYLNLVAEVKVGGIIFNEIHSCEIVQTVVELSDSATLVLPRMYRDKLGESVLEKLKVGQAVSIKLGYNDELNEEFTGYVREIEADIPIKIHIDDEMYHFKRNCFIESWEKASLKQVLETINNGMTVVCPEMNLGKYSVPKVSSYMVFMDLKQKFGLYTYIKNDKLYCNFANDIKDDSVDVHTYEYGRNIKKNKLKFKRKEDHNIKLVAIANLPDGSKLKVVEGNTDQNATTKTINFGNIDEKDLKYLAIKEFNKLVYEGYTGSITGFGQPLTKAGDILKIIDKLDKDREGKYLIESVKIRWGNAYFERINTLSYRIPDKETK